MCPERVRRPLAVLGLTVALALGVSACTGSGSGATSGSPDATGASSTPGSTSPDAAPTVSSPAPKSSGHGTRTPTRGSHPGSLSVVPTHAVHTLSPVPLDSKAAFGTGVTARVTAISHGVDRDQGPGAATGRPTVEFHLRLTNGTSATIRLSAVEVTAAYGSSSTPAIVASTSTSAFSGRVAAGASVDAVYAFVVPRSSQGKVDLAVSYRAGTPTVLLTGSAR